jgi:hypothetical protein
MQTHQGIDEKTTAETDFNSSLKKSEGCYVIETHSWMPVKLSWIEWKADGNLFLAGVNKQRIYLFIGRKRIVAYDDGHFSISARADYNTSANRSIGHSQSFADYSPHVEFIVDSPWQLCCQMTLLVASHHWEGKIRFFQIRQHFKSLCYRNY